MHRVTVDNRSSAPSSFTTGPMRCAYGVASCIGWSTIATELPPRGARCVAYAIDRADSLSRRAIFPFLPHHFARFWLANRFICTQNAPKIRSALWHSAKNSAVPPLRGGRALPPCGRPSHAYRASRRCPWRSHDGGLTASLAVALPHGVEVADRLGWRGVGVVTR